MKCGLEEEGTDERTATVEPRQRRVFPSSALHAANAERGKGESGGVYRSELLCNAGPFQSFN